MKDPIFYRFARPILKFLVFVLYKPKVIGKENIPKDGGIVIAGNHTNNFDCILLITSTKRCIHFLAKDSLYKGIKKPLFKNMGIIPVNRKAKNPQAVSVSEEVLNRNGTIGIFPEGTINRTKDIVMPFKIGAVKMASDTNSYIVPFSITGKYKIFNNKLTLIFGKPYKISSKELETENKKLMKKVTQLIKEGRKDGAN